MIFLSNMGFPQENKTAEAAPPTCDYDINAFWRGVIDGDGSLGIRKTSKGGHEGFLSLSTQSEKLKDAFCEYLHSITKETYNPQRNKRDNIYNIGCGMSSSKKICDKMYGNATIYLDRKYKKYLEMINFIKENNIKIKKTYILQQIDPISKAIIKTYNTCAEAERETGWSHIADYSNPNKKEKIYHGFIWRRTYDD